MKRKYQCIECGLEMKETTLSYNGNNPNKNRISLACECWRWAIIPREKYNPPKKLNWGKNKKPRGHNWLPNN